MTTTTTLVDIESKIYNPYPNAVSYLPPKELSIALEDKQGITFSTLDYPLQKDILYYKNGKNFINKNISEKCRYLKNMNNYIRDKCMENDRKVYDIQTYMKIIDNEIYIIDIQLDTNSLNYKDIIRLTEAYKFRNLPIIKIDTYEKLVELNKDCIIYSINPLNFNNKNIRKYTIEKRRLLNRINLHNIESNYKDSDSDYDIINNIDDIYKSVDDSNESVDDLYESVDDSNESVDDSNEMV